ncbi:MAG: PEP-CTERM sorting domain-containing protein [Phycisphaerae bacterium]|nr:PEP-CTERM sorting domain-containing protein [Tepidisphaeraceae bacterium]
MTGKQCGMAVVAAVAAMWAGAAEAAFTHGNLYIVQVGTAGGTLSDAAQPVSLVEFNPAGVQVGAAHALPSTGASTALTLSGAGSHDGHLNFSTNGQYLLLGGYRANAGAANPVIGTSAGANRVIGRIDSTWAADTTTALNDAYDQTEMTAVVSDTGSRFWTAGSGSYVSGLNSLPTTTGGLRYVGAVGATSSVNVSRTQATGGANAPDSLRGAKLIDGQIYVNTAAKESFDNKRGIFTTTPALPTSGAAAVADFVVNADGNPADSTGKFAPKTDFVLFDLNPSVPGFDVAYGTGGKLDYEKWSLVGGQWTRATNKSIASGEIQAMDGMLDASGNVVLYATTATAVYKLTDTAGYGNDFSTTFAQIYAAPAGTEFRGLAVAVPEPGMVGAIAVAGVGMMMRRRRK